MSNKPKYCFSNCEFFQCGKRALYFKGKDPQCKYAEDVCEPKNCKFARCVKGRLISDGICGMTIKAKRFEVNPEEVEDPIELPGKLAQRIKEKQVY